MLLRDLTEAERSLMDRTLGNPEHVSSATVVELLEAVKNEMILSPNSERDAALASVTTMQREAPFSRFHGKMWFPFKLRLLC
jgi:hypothetical protein